MHAARREKGSRRLGVIAFVLAAASAVAGAALQFAAGHQLGGIARFPGVADVVRGGGAIDPSTLPADAQAIADQASTLSLIGLAVWIALALWAFIQGIAAVVQRRGRAWGVAAIVVSVVGHVIAQAGYTLGITLGAAPHL